MGSLNKIMLIGNLGRNSELRYSQSGMPTSSFPIAVNKVYKNEKGDKVEKTTWVNVVMFGKQAETLNEHLTKGKLIYVEGELNIDKYTDKEGVERYSTKVIGRVIQFLGEPKDKKDVSGEPAPEDTESQEPAIEPPQGHGEDIPF